MTVSNFDCTQAEFGDFLKYREITIKSCLDNDEADKFFQTFIKVRFFSSILNLIQRKIKVVNIRTAFCNRKEHCVLREAL